MAYTQEQLDALKAAYATGVRRVSYNGRDVTYASSDEMLKAIREIEGELATAAGVPVVRRSYATFSKGYGPCRGDRW